MRALLLCAMLLAIAFAGCLDETTTPSVSVNYSRSTQTQNGQTTTQISATLTAVNGLTDWNELSITGCSAPAEGTIETPHKFTSCSGALRIVHRTSGDVLYQS